MSIEMDQEFNRSTAHRKSALVLDIIQGKTTVSESSRQFDLPPSEIESWIDQAKAGMENALRTKPGDIREQYDWQLKSLQEAYDEVMLDLRTRKMGRPVGEKGRSMILHIQQGLKQDEFTVPMTKLCR